MGPSAVCGGSTYGYTTTGSAGATSYIWKLDGTTLPGSGTTNNVTFPPGYSGGNLCVLAVSSCGQQSASSCFAITSSGAPPIGPILSNLPVTGLCDATGVLFFLSSSDADSYSWTVPSCATIVSSPPYSQSIVVNFSNCSGGVIQVTAQYQCGPSTATLNVSGIPAKPIITPDHICSNDDDRYYQVNPPSTGATNYTWTVSDGTVNNFALDNSDGQVFWNNPASSGVSYFSVTADNACGSSAAKLVNNIINCRLAEKDNAGNLNAEVYPNPSQGMLTVRFNSAAGSEYELKLTDLTGREISVEQFHSVEGVNYRILDLGALAKGMYLVSLTSSSGKSMVSRVTLQ
jgi:hypothetical protein